MVPDLPKSLNGHLFTFQAGLKPKRIHIFRDIARLADAEIYASTGRPSPTVNSALFDRFARHTRHRVQRPRIQRSIRVGDPRHFTLSGAVVGRRNIYPRTNEILTHQFIRVAAGDAL